MIDVRQFVGQVHEVTDDQSGRRVTVEIGDGGPCPFWDHRQMLRMTCSFSDGKRSNVNTASGAAHELAAKLFAPCSVAAMGGDGWELAVEREYRSSGPKNGRTKFTFTVFPGPLERSEDEYRERAGLTEVEARFAAAKAEFGL